MAVLQEGEVEAGDSIELVARDEHAVTVADIVDLYVADAPHQDLLQRVSALPALPKGWHAYFGRRLSEPDA
jgi:MOSC domain-containing protein YiiM